MAFHVACPITCRRICFCALGFARGLQAEKGKNEFLQEVAKLEDFLNDPWLIKARENATIQVKVPKVEVVSPAPPPPPVADSAVAVGSEEVAAAASAQVKRVALQKQAAAASVVAEDYARRFESGDLVAPLQETAGEELGLSNVKVMCRMCFSGENEGSERARKMLSCNSCGKKYHRSCLKSWSQNRDLFHWSSWTCPSCRTCEVCRRTGDPNKFMFCKRCDGAYHCYCQQPPHKNVGHGPYLCPKHTKCHSCGSSVPGNGLSVRWFLGNTCCDACGRLFVKGNYCPVCLKVYRDSEATPMVCCDICEHWVHCPCDGISDAKYMQFQSDGNLQYVCPTCRGECYKIKNLEEAVQELWRRRDEADKDLIASLRAAAGLPTQEEIFDISPFSDDEESGPLVKNEFSRSLKFSVKGLGDKSPMKGKEHGKRSSSKKHVKKKGNELSLISRNNIDGPLLGYNSSSDYKKDEMQFSGEPVTHSPVAGSLNEGMYSVKEAADPRNKNIDDVSATSGTKKSRTIKIKSSKAHSLTSKEESGTNTGLKTAQGSKLVIHLGGRNRNANSPPRSEASSLQKGQDMTPSDVGTEDTSQLKHHELDRLDPETKFRDQKGYKTDHTDQVKTSKIKFKNVSSEVSNSSSKPTGRYSSTKYTEDGPTVSGDMIDDSNSVPSKLQASSKDGKTNLKFKIPKNSNSGNQNIPSKSNNNGNQITLPLPGKEEITYTRGQRSKRRRPASGEGDTSQWGEDNTVKDFTDANWILQKLGKDAAGKRVEVHQSSNNTWHRGTVIEVFEGTSIVSIALDDGKTNNYELGKQGIRFVSQKQKS